MAHHADRYTFTKPASVRECKERMRALLNGIRDVQMQLGDKARRTKEGYLKWRGKAMSSLLYKQAEYDYLKDALISLRREADAQNAEVWEPNDPRHLLMRLRGEIGKHLTEESNKLSDVLDVVDRYFEHDGG